VSYRTRQRARRKTRRYEPAPAQPTVDAEELNLPYPVMLVQDGDGSDGEWVATVDALAGCTARAATPHEALAAVADAVSEWVEAAASDGREVPEPKSLQSHSGRLLLRMPQTLHAELSRVAERERVSLNQFITDVLAGALGWRVPARAGRIATAVPHRTTANGDGEEQLSVEADAASPQRRSARFVTAALVVNFIVVAIAAVVAIVVLIAAWT
jgi:predicted RNase H-like HicB family nuclease